MTTRKLAAGLVLLLTCSSAGSNALADRTFVTNYENVLGTSLELKIQSPTQTAADRAEKIVLDEITRQSRILSSWDPSSEVSTWAKTHGQPVRVSKELFEVLDLFDRWRDRTHGAIDASAQAVIRAWTGAAAQHRLPSDSELSSALRTVRQQHWRLDAAHQTATHLSDAPLVLASFTKSYIIDRAVTAAMAVDGVHGVVLNIGGDIVTRGDATTSVDVANPRDNAENAAPMAEIVVRDRAVATSGDYRRGFDIDGVHYSHIVDPRTGRPAGGIISATVVAPNPTDAGALATAFSILTPAESRALASSIPGVDYLLVDRAGARIASAGWKALEIAAPAPAPGPSVAPAAQGVWDPTMELSVNFEIPVQGGPAKRPFIAIWIEDADRFPIRTLALWYHEDRWLPEMKAWYRADRLRSMSETRSIVRSIGAATRPPGKYTIKWDGKDNDGQPVKAGKYTVYLESSREHGTYQLLKQEMTFGSAPQHVDFKPGIEIATASFDYHKIPR